MIGGASIPARIRKKGRERDLTVLSLCLHSLACGVSTPPSYCLSSNQCTLGNGGSCVAFTSGHSWCLYPDPRCPGGSRGARWSPQAGDGLSSQCVAAHQLSIVPAGTGAGRVTSIPDGIDCGA